MHTPCMHHANAEQFVLRDQEAAVHDGNTTTLPNMALFDHDCPCTLKETSQNLLHVLPYHASQCRSW
eukprot:scaffold37541_cov18-Tisochrysis_lutea.AAC.4